MTLSSCFAVPGSPYRSLARASAAAFPIGTDPTPSRSAPFLPARLYHIVRTPLSTLTSGPTAICSPSRRTLPLRGTLTHLDLACNPLPQRRLYSESNGALEQAINDEDKETFNAFENMEATLQQSRSKLKAQRQSQPQFVLDAIQGPSADYYYRTPSDKVDLSYNSLHRARQMSHMIHRSGKRKFLHPSQENYPVSLYTILASYLRDFGVPSWAESKHSFTDTELRVLQSRGFARHEVKRWASSILEPNPLIGAQVILMAQRAPPMFLVLIFLRRRNLSTYALSIIMQHIDKRVKVNTIDWNTLRILTIRLLRHARKTWPESIPWISSLFTTEARRIRDETLAPENTHSALRADMGHFCNAFIKLLSLPATLQPVLSSRFQEKGQFEVLKFMASHSPPFSVSKAGFRGLSRVQLAHAKTPQEQEWARLKSSTWPPWKQSQTALDEDKGYQYGMSRASKIMHRMFEAGYPPGKFETMVELYAGWDADLSPTIQTRTSLPRISTYYRDSGRLQALIWAARIRATRTRREAWACFLAYEASKAPASQDVYQAMFEKLFYPLHVETGSQARPKERVLPGDVKEPMPEPTSPLDQIYLSEPVDTLDQLYNRMVSRNVQPTGRVLAFLIETASSFKSGLHRLQSAGRGQSQIGSLIDGSIIDKPAQLNLGPSIPSYLLAAVIRLLCRFGRFSEIPTTKTRLAFSPEDHLALLQTDGNYRLEYALSLLLHLRPRYRPAWTAYMRMVIVFPCDEHLLHPPHTATQQIKTQYTMMVMLLEKMDEIGLELDQDQFKLVCDCLRSIAREAFKGHLTSHEAAHIISTEPRRLRSQFNTLVNVHLTHSSLVPSSPSPTGLPPMPRIPQPWLLHAYIRALGTFRDFEGLYSLSTWITNHVPEINEVAKSHHSGARAWRRTIVALRAALEGLLEKNYVGPRAQPELVELTKAQIDAVEEWGGWATEEDVEDYRAGRLKGYGS